MSKEDSTQCTKCIRDNRSLCNTRPLSPAQMQKITSFYAQLEDALEEAEEQRKIVNAEIKRLQKQKQLWLEKITHAVARGINNLEELEKVERKEAEAAARQATTLEPNSAASPSLAVDDVN